MQRSQVIAQFGVDVDDLGHERSHTCGKGRQAFVHVRHGIQTLARLRHLREHGGRVDVVLRAAERLTRHHGRFAQGTGVRQDSRFGVKRFVLAGLRRHLVDLRYAQTQQGGGALPLLGTGSQVLQLSTHLLPLLPGVLECLQRRRQRRTAESIHDHALPGGLP